LPFASNNSNSPKQTRSSYPRRIRSSMIIRVSSSVLLATCNLYNPTIWGICITHGILVVMSTTCDKSCGLVIHYYPDPSSQKAVLLSLCALNFLLFCKSSSTRGRHLQYILGFVDWCFFTLYHSESPLNHHLGNLYIFFSKHLIIMQI